MLGKPAYFDVSVQNSLQPHHILRAAVEAGAASEAGEINNNISKGRRQNHYYQT